MSMKRIVQRLEERGAFRDGTLRVFLSSTGDMPDFRDAVSAAIDRFDSFRVVRMEDFVGSFMEVDDYCRRKIETCHICVCLAGDRYGSTPHDDPRSYTLIEYETAKRLGLPVLAYVAPEGTIVVDPNRRPNSEDDAARQQEFRRRLGKEQTPGKRDSWTSPEALALSIVTALTETREYLFDYQEQLATEAAAAEGRAAPPEGDTGDSAPQPSRGAGRPLVHGALAACAVAVLAVGMNWIPRDAVCSAVRLGDSFCPPAIEPASFRSTQADLTPLFAAIAPTAEGEARYDAATGVLSLRADPAAAAPFAFTASLAGLAKHVGVATAEPASDDDAKACLEVDAATGALRLVEPLQDGAAARFVLNVAREPAQASVCSAVETYWRPLASAAPFRSGEKSYVAPDLAAAVARSMSLSPNAQGVWIDPAGEWVRFRLSDGDVFMPKSKVRIVSE